MNDYQTHLTEPPIPVGGYLPKTISDEELKKIIKDQADMCMAILNGDEIQYQTCDNCGQDHKYCEPKNKEQFGFCGNWCL